MRNRLVLSSVVVLCSGFHVLAAVPGSVEDFATDTAGFAGGSILTHVTSDGVGGSGDGYLQVSNPSPGFLGAFTQAPGFTGNLNSGGVTGFSFWLRDTGADDNHEIHVGVGTPINFWQNVNGFVPPDGQWQQFSVDLTNEADWVQIIGAGTFAEAKATTDRILFRHDLAPFMQTPNTASGEFGLDRLAVEPSDVPAVSTWGLLCLALLVAVAGHLVQKRRAIIA